MLIALLLLAFVALALKAPDTPAGRIIRRWLIERPAKLRASHLVLFALLALASVGLILWLRGEATFLLGSGLPEALGWFAAFDVATYAEVIAAAWLAATVMRLKALKAAVHWIVRRIRPAAPRRRPRRRSARPRRPAPLPADDEPIWAIA
jgi:hypothetical protein